MKTITSENYVENVLRTESVDIEAIRERLTDDVLRLFHATQGMCTETGEFMDVLKKHMFYGKPLDKVNLEEELGDMLWYIGLAIDALGLSMDSVMIKNIAKLRARYPEKFDEHNAKSRDLETERRALVESGS